MAIELKKLTNSAPAATSSPAPTTSSTPTAASVSAPARNVNQSISIYQSRDFSYVSTEEQEKRKSFSANDWADDLFRNGNGLFDSRIKDNAHLVEKNLIGNEDWRVDKRVDSNNDGKLDENDKLESVSLLDAIVDSYDSALDLYIEQELQNIIDEYGPTVNYNLRAIFGDPNSAAIKELAALGIRADAVGDHDQWQNRTYTFSLVDMSNLKDNPTEQEILDYVYGEDAKILEDEQGNKGSIIFADCLTADGTAQGAELNLSSILDQMGYECVSKADYIDDPEAYKQLLSDIRTGLDNNLFISSENTINDMYGETLTMAEAVCAVYDINGDAPGQWMCKGRTFEQTKEAVERKKANGTLFKGGCAIKGDKSYANLADEKDIEKYDSNKNGTLDKIESEKLKKETGKIYDKEKLIEFNQLKGKTKAALTEKESIADLNQALHDELEKNPNLDVEKFIEENAKKFNLTVKVAKQNAKY